MSGINKANQEAANAGRFDRVSGDGESGGGLIPRGIDPDEIVSPFPRSGRGGPRRAPVMDAEYEIMSKPARGIGMREQGRIGYQEPIGSAPEAAPMSPRDEFRRELAAEARSVPRRPPPIETSPFPRLGYDEASDLPLQMRMHPELF
jgi:hypothetical protein